MADIPKLSHAKIQKRSAGYVLICGDPSECERPIGKLQDNGVHRDTSPHGKDIHVSVFTAEDHELIAKFLRELRQESCQKAA